jgi:hypothetical protein
MREADHGGALRSRAERKRKDNARRGERRVSLRKRKQGFTKEDTEGAEKRETGRKTKPA